MPRIVNAVPAGTALVIPAAASARDGPATSSASASRDVATVYGRVRRVGTTVPSRVNHSCMLTVRARDAVVVAPVDRADADGAGGGGESEAAGVGAEAAGDGGA